ncbi:MAG: META domain-containing protein [Candidatus Latescibacterota bacterium]|nr:MAG: META domain-containing protein [Candidatus Latescibacterota bacterium]
MRSERMLLTALLLLLACGREAERPAEEPLPPPAAGAGEFPPEFSGVELRWTALVTPVERIDVQEPQHYTLKVLADGKLEIRADCNRAFGSIEFVDDHRVKIGALGSTRAMCPPGSHSQRFLQELERATTYFVRDGKLYLELPYDSGTLHFARAE